MNFSHYGDVAGNSDNADGPGEPGDRRREAPVAAEANSNRAPVRQVPVIPLPSPASSWFHNARTLEIGYPIHAYMGTFTLSKASSKR